MVYKIFFRSCRLSFYSVNIAMLKLSLMYPICFVFVLEIMSPLTIYCQGTKYRDCAYVVCPKCSWQVQSCG